MHKNLPQWGSHCARERQPVKHHASTHVVSLKRGQRAACRSHPNKKSSKNTLSNNYEEYRKRNFRRQIVFRSRNGDSDRVEGSEATSSAHDQQQAVIWQTFVQSIIGKNSYDTAILSLALPAIVALAADPLLSFVDTIFVGQAGADALAALGVNSALFTFSFLVFSFLATATTPLVAAALAKGDADKAGKVTMQAFLVAAVLGTALWGGLVVGAEAALGVMGAGVETGSLHSLAREFLVIRAFASPAVLVGTVGMGVFRGLQDMRTPLAITLGTNAVNLALDTVLILGLGWGVRGAATATCTAEWLAAGVYLALLWGRREQLGGLHPGSLLGPKAAQTLEEFAPFLKAGGAVLMRSTLLLGTKTLAAATATRLGAVPIASHQVVSQLWLLSSFLLDSLAIAGQTLVAVELGKGDVPAARAVSDRLLQLGAVLGLLVAGVFWVGSPILPQLVGGNADIDAAVHSILPLAIGMVPINAAVYVLDGILVGASDFKFLAGAMLVAATTGGGLLLGVEPLGLGLQGVWGALALLMFSRLGTLVWRYQDPKGPLPPTTPPFPPMKPHNQGSTPCRSRSVPAVEAREGSSQTPPQEPQGASPSQAGANSRDGGDSSKGARDMKQQMSGPETETVRQSRAERRRTGGGLLANNALARPPSALQQGKSTGIKPPSE